MVSGLATSGAASIGPNLKNVGDDVPEITQAKTRQGRYALTQKRLRNHPANDGMKQRLRFLVSAEGGAFSSPQHEYHDAALLSSDQMNGNFMKQSQRLTLQLREVQPILILYVAPYHCCFDLFIARLSSKSANVLLLHGTGIR
ncbi:unnamed protein product [Dovyalis caffra]|uniref:Uncharacterized protein n=1 Tax=Dovyalis caffra TaxID=77055 RepID=A0AAV1QUZ7_9ROSI|nr:unnamed protein product [Dovyalis caffra]